MVMRVRTVLTEVIEDGHGSKNSDSSSVTYFLN